MDRLMNIARREAERVMQQRSHSRIGIVTSYDPGNYAAKVEIQPEGVETGWLPIGTQWSGNGWGDYAPPAPGDIVEVNFQEGGKQAGSVGNRYYGDRIRPLNVPSGERWIVHKSGSFFKFLNDGTIQLTGHSNINITAPSVNITGNLNVTGDIIDRSLTGGFTMASFRATFDIHTHGNVMAGGDHTAIPDQIL